MICWTQPSKRGVGTPGDYASVARLLRDELESSDSALVTHTFPPGCCAKPGRTATPRGPSVVLEATECARWKQRFEKKLKS